ncbi:uncharacterized protein Z520_04447 [Fonsecaea multimorphosa CBS 102226]|uniref:Uncharacterized protein n=1 Tax=Fonsecaea multimorphosa CBS 102226 TaxID=1442371 RepID=A0A0D2IS33_9EURO|nr:uncharacterized protein Z520_04447 [Fonsecaea multimorphosa CBS 102226]KIX99811.1 hypothetical protein Z520_04447 [Fonsecaea multimorphosa CBS 102226]OAL26471.1 hypothetical protein AYO22_04209 [Fonsecaea multimorphosa]
MDREQYDLGSMPPSHMSTPDHVKLLSGKDSPGVSVTIGETQSAPYHRRHSRGHSGDERLRSIDETESMRDEPYDLVEPVTPIKARRFSAGQSAASSVLRRLTTKINPMSRGTFRSTKRSQGREYATLDDGEDGQAATVDLSSLEGMGWELTDLSNPDAARLQDEEIESESMTKKDGKPDFRKFVQKRASVGDGMKGVGVQLRRDPSRIVRRGTGGMGNAESSGIDRSKTVRDLGQDLALKKNMIVEVEEIVDLSTLDGGELENRQSRTFETMPMRQSVLPQETKSYFFPDDPDIPNWKPRSMRSWYILSLMALALGLAGFQEFLCQKSFKSVREHSGILAFNAVAEISTWDFFVWKYLPTMITIVYAVLFSIMDFDIRRLEPFYQLSRPRGASAAASLNLDHLTMFQYFIPFKAFRLRQWAVFFSTTGNIMASMVSPALQNPSITFATNPDPRCNASGCPNGEKHYWVRISPGWSRALSASYVFVAIVVVILWIQLRRKSGLLSDPKGIAGIASMATKSHILQDFAGLDEANCAIIHKRLAHRRYVLYKSSIWQGEWSSKSEPPQDSERKLTSPHPLMLQMRAGIPFLAFMVFCLISVPIITLTKARVVPNAAPWLPILIATGLKLFFSTFESDVRLMEPFYQLSRGNARPENSLTLDYQATVYGIMPFKALLNKHYLLALVGVSSVLLDVLTVTVSSFSVNSEDFMHVGSHGEDRSNGDETFVSFWTSLVLSVFILLFVIFTTSLVYLRRRHPFLPREPSTIAAVLAFIYASNMLSDFVDTETLNNKAMEKRLKNINKRYALGWFKGRDGQIHCAIDEEPMRSKYVHGKPYTMAQAGPLHETYYSVA